MRVKKSENVGDNTSSNIKTQLIVLSLAIFSTVFVVSCQSSKNQSPIKESRVSDFNQALTTLTEVELGKMLYFDPRLSVDGTISCNSCHNVMNGGSDNRQVSMGVRGQLGARNSPTVFNATFLSVQFWDGREPDLKEQAKGPLINPVEMGNKDLDEVVTRLEKIPGYAAAFKKVYPGEESLNGENLATAIAAYEKTLTTLNSPYDKFVSGDLTAFSEIEKKGFETFKSVGCTSCHAGSHFAGPELPVGTGFFMKFPTFVDGNSYINKYKLTKDKGRFEVTKNKADIHMYRVPTLRNVALTAPYFHNGSVGSLDEAVKVMAKSQLNRDLNAEEVDSIVTFLKTLTGSIAEQTLPVVPPTVGHIVN